MHMQTATATGAITGAEAATSKAAKGPLLCLTAAAIALVVTGLAATAVPSLAKHATTGFDISGAWMCLSDALFLAAILVFVRSDALRDGRLTRVSTWLAVIGSAAAVVAEAMLRADFSLGTDAFSVAGPMQALGIIGLGIAVVRAHRWSGWHRFTWLLLGLYVPLVLVPALAHSGGQNLAALAGFHGCIALVGVAWLAEVRRPRA